MMSRLEQRWYEILTFALYSWLLRSPAQIPALSASEMRCVQSELQNRNNVTELVRLYLGVTTEG
jgi:hypothetical protein